MVRAVQSVTDCPWVLLYVKRWLASPLASAGQPAWKKGMEESYIEDVATHDGPEPCVGDP